MNHLLVDDIGTTFTFIDNGAPDGSNSYLTIIAVHGTGFGAAIFSRIQSVALSHSVRFVAVNRRGYGRSTPVTEKETKRAKEGSEEDKATFHEARGAEFATFVELFIQTHRLPPISPDGRHGGVTLLGWSSGNSLTLSAIAEMHKFSTRGMFQFCKYIRAHIILDPSTLALGLPSPPKLWNPHMDSSIPSELRGAFHTQWITSYFDHPTGSLATRNTDSLSYIVPSESRAPSIYSMTAQDVADIIEDEPADEGMIMLACQKQNYAIYRKAIFDSGIRKSLPSLKTSVLAGERTCASALNAIFTIESDTEKVDGTIHFEIIPGVNHFAHWDEPEKTFQAIVNATLL